LANFGGEDVKKRGKKVHKSSAMSKHQKILIGIAITFLLYSLLGFLVLPVVLKSILENKLSQNLKREVTIENIQINPYLLRVAVSNFQVQNHARDHKFIAFDQLHIDLEGVSIFKRALVVKSLVLNGPRVNIARYKDLTYNFSDIAVGSGQKKKTPAKPFLFSLNNIEILNGAITFLDEPKDTTHRVRSLNFAIPFLSNVVHHVEIHVEPSLTAIINNTPVNLSGRTIPFHNTRSTVFDIRAGKLNIPDYLSYLPRKGNLTLKSGFLDITATLGFEMQAGNKPTVTLAGDFSIREIDLATEDETYLAIPQVDIKLVEAKPLEMNFHFSHFSIAEPEFQLYSTLDGDLFPLALLAENSKPKADEPGTKDNDSALKLVVDEIALNRGTLHFKDQSNTEQFQATLQPIDIKVMNLSTREGAEASYKISMLTEAEENIAINGMMSLSPFGTKLHIAFQDMQIPRYSPYYSEFILPRIMEGSLDLSADISFMRSGNANKLKADNITAAFGSVAVNDRNNGKILAIPSFEMKETSLDLNEREIIVGDLASSDGDIHLERQKEGFVLLKELLRPREEQKKTDAAEADTSPRWSVKLKKSAISQYSIFLLDHTFAEPTTVVFDNLRLSAENISNIENQKGMIDLGLRVDKMGIISIKGPVNITPLSFSLTLDAADVQVKNLQPYFADKVTLANSDGNVSLKGQLKVSKDKDQAISAQFKGNGSITDFVSFDPQAGEEFLKWKNLRLGEMDYDSGRFAFRIKEVLWQDFYNKIIVFEDSSVNLKAVMKGPSGQGVGPLEADAPEKAPAKSRSLLVEIDSVKLDNGEIAFLDRNITPNYTSSFSELTGTITGLSSRADVTAEINISGNLDQHAPLRITGRVNPLRDELYADLVLNFNDIELSPTSPYTGKFVGYTVSKGKLSLDLHYLVEGRSITGKNKAFLDQFTLGDTVESPDAMSLPVKLAIALLKNRQGEIILNVPVEGNLDDPEFSIGGVVFKAIVNLIAKAATSPFALLGAIIPDGEDLQYVEFEPGSTHIAVEYTANLEAVAKALYERPGLEMDIRGDVKADEEKPVLHEKQFARLLKNEKLKELTRKKEMVLDQEQIIIEPEEYETFLKKVYKEATFEKPKNFIGLDKKLPAEEMEKLLRDNIKITWDDLRLLAIGRANAVKAFLVEAGPVEPERIFIVEPIIAEGEGGYKRAEMIIK
jgi:hypothetical protein